MEKSKSEGIHVIELSDAELVDWSELSASGDLRHIAYDPVLTEAHEIALRKTDVDNSYRRELGRQAEIPEERLIGDDGWHPELMTLSHEDGADKLTDFRMKAPDMPELARWEAFQSPAERLPLDAVKDAIAAAEAAQGTLAGDWTEQGYYRGCNYYLRKEGLLEQIRDALPPPPAADSPEQLKDLDAVRMAQTERTDGRLARVRGDAEMSILRFADVLGDKFDLEKLPITADVLDQAFVDGDNALNCAKRAYDRPRPFMEDPSIETVVERPGNASYPSGHSFFGNLNARLLSRLLPEYADELMPRGNEYGDNRIIAGVHFPSDVRGGRLAAGVIETALMSDPVFVADFERARVEIRQVFGLPLTHADQGAAAETGASPEYLDALMASLENYVDGDAIAGAYFPADSANDESEILRRDR